MKKFEYKVVPVSLNLPVGKKGYEKAASEFEIQLKYWALKVGNSFSA